MDYILAEGKTARAEPTVGIEPTTCSLP
ncbi:MAG: hypothetical protein ACD_38C00032G0007, partial [uncultured bacterium]